MDPWRLIHLVVEHLQSLWSLSTVKHGFFLFAYFLVQMKNLKHLEICACPVAVCYFSIIISYIAIAVDQ